VGGGLGHHGVLLHLHDPQAARQTSAPQHLWEEDDSLPWIIGALFLGWPYVAFKLIPVCLRIIRRHL